MTDEWTRGQRNITVTVVYNEWFLLPYARSTQPSEEHQYALSRQVRTKSTDGTEITAALARLNRQLLDRFVWRGIRETTKSLHH